MPPTGLAALLAIALAANAQAAPTPSPTPTPASEAQPAVKDPLNYETLTHTLSIDTLRAGSHDESGSNDYYFSVAMYGLLNSTEERNLSFDQRKKITVERGTFGETQLESLAVWRPDDKLKNYKEHKIEGHAIRELAARAMQEFKAQEADVAVMVEIAMFEKNKRFFFLGDDTPIAKTVYYPIPLTKFDAPLRTNQTLVISDDKGTHVKLAVKYDPKAG